MFGKNSYGLKNYDDDGSVVDDAGFLFEPTLNQFPSGSIAGFQAGSLFQDL